MLYNVKPDDDIRNPSNNDPMDTLVPLWSDKARFSPDVQALIYVCGILSKRTIEASNKIFDLQQEVARLSAHHPHSTQAGGKKKKAASTKKPSKKGSTKKKASKRK